MVKKKEGAQRSTDCSNFSLRLRKPESIFSLLLEPARDYRKGKYTHYDRKTAGVRTRDDYGTAAKNARAAAKLEQPQGGGNGRFHKPLPTLWGELNDLLPTEDRERLQVLADDPQRAENFGSYVKNGFLFASPVIVELYCWYVEFLRGKPVGDAQRRYLAFVGFIRSRLKRSMALAYSQR